MADPVHNSDDHGDLQLARMQGCEEAKALDMRLRQRETDEREYRLAGLAWKPQNKMATSEAAEDSLRVVQLEARISELNTYVRSVHESLPWRIIQRIRGVFGRSW